jgi:hypothetical protein
MAGWPWRLSAIPFRYAWLLGTGQEIHALVGATALDEYLALVPDIAPVQWLWGALILGGLVWLGWRVWQRGDGYDQESAIKAELLVFIWLLAPLFFFAWLRLPVALHYLLPIYPAPYMAVGMLFARLRQRWRRLGWIGLLVSAACQVWLWAGLLSFISSHATPGGFGQPLARQLQAATIATRLLAEENAAEVLIAGAGESPAQEEFPAIYATLLRAVPHRFVDIRRSAVFPAAPTIILLASEVGQAGALYETAAIHQERIPLRKGEGAISLLALPATAAPTPEITLESPQILTNWAAFLGYDLPLLQEDATALWQIYWYAGEPALIDYHIFNHLLNAGGKRISQADAAAFPAWQWREGDVVVSRFTLPWPKDTARPLTMRTGMYTFPQLEAVLLFDVAGNPYSDALEMTLP